MKGELAYKDIHGRVWRLRERSTFMWLGETLDEGHTENHHRSATSIERILDDIDREEYLIGRSAQPLESPAAGGQFAETSGESSPETIEEISRNASEDNGSSEPRN